MRLNKNGLETKERDNFAHNIFTTILAYVCRETITYSTDHSGKEIFFTKIIQYKIYKEKRNRKYSLYYCYSTCLTFN